MLLSGDISTGHARVIERVGVPIEQHDAKLRQAGVALDGDLKQTVPVPRFGLAEVLGVKLEYFANQTLGAISGYLRKKVIPVIIGNDGATMYMIDGHHTAYTLAWWKAHILARLPQTVAAQWLGRSRGVSGRKR